MVCVEAEPVGICPFAVAHAIKQNASIDPATSKNTSDLRAQQALTYGRDLRVVSFSPAKVAEVCGIDVSGYAFDRKETNQPTCHAFVSELSFLCCTRKKSQEVSENTNE